MKYNKLAAERPGYHWAWLIFDTEGNKVGMCRAVKTSGGTVYVDFWDFTHTFPDGSKGCQEVQQAKCSGGGYDKIAHALASMTFAGERVSGEGHRFELVERRGFKVYQAI